MTIFILICKELDLSPFFCQLLSALLMSDSSTIISTFLLFSLPQLLQVSPHIFPVCLPLAQVSLTLSVFLIMSLSADRLRLLMISSPLQRVTFVLRCKFNNYTFLETFHLWVDNFPAILNSVHSFQHNQVA